MRKFTLKRKGSSIHPIYSEYRDIAQYWMLQLLVPLGAHKELIQDNHCRDDEVLHELGLSRVIDTVHFSKSDARQELFDLHKAASEKPSPKIPDNTKLAKNIRWLGEAMELNSTEQAILHFRVVASRHLSLRVCVENLGKGLDQLSIINLLSKLIGDTESNVEQALQPSGKLLRTGLITISPKLNSLTDKIGLLQGLADNLFGKYHDPYALFHNNFTQAGPSKLTKEDYPHLKEDISLLDNYLTEALENKQPGVNVLIYGTPGSGKTEFVKMLAHEIGRPLFEVATENSAGDPIRRSDRFRSFRLSQHILSTSKTIPIILFDEVEDVFRMGEDEDDKKAENPSGMKGWINKLLEENQIPSFWLSNNLRYMDKAFVRRFDYVIELNAPPRSVRSKILDQYLDGIEVSPTWKATMAEHEHLNPAVVERAAKVIEIAKQRQPELSAEKALDRILGNTLEALGLPSMWPMRLRNIAMSCLLVLKHHRP